MLRSGALPSPGPPSSVVQVHLMMQRCGVPPDRVGIVLGFLRIGHAPQPGGIRPRVVSGLYRGGSNIVRFKAR